MKPSRASIRPRLRFIRRMLGDTTGAAAIEMAIVLPVLLWFIMGIIEFGILFHLKSLATYAANEAARMGKTGYTYNGGKDRQVVIEDSIKDVMSPWFNKNTELEIGFKTYGSFRNITASGTPGLGGGSQVGLYTVTFHWQALTPLLAQAMGRRGTIPITAQVLVKNEDF